MTRDEAETLLSRWRDRFKDIQSVFDAACELHGGDGESRWAKAVYSAFAGYTEMLAIVVGDDDGWLDWFLWENSAGRNKLEAKAASWDKPRPIKTVRDLVDVIFDTKVADDG